MTPTTYSRNFRFLPGGVECDERGLRVSGVTLVTKNALGNWVCLCSQEISLELSQVYGFPIDFSSKQFGLQVVARALEIGRTAEAQVAALMLQLPEPLLGGRTSIGERQRLSDELMASGLIKIDNIASKYNFNPDEPRDNRGRWTNGQLTSGPEGRATYVDEVAYQGDFHDSVVQDEIAQYRKSGAICVSEVRLSLGDITARLDILCRGKSGVLLGAEIKTGTDPDFTLQQKIVYAHALAGGLASPDVKISQLGLPVNTSLPPFEIFLIYASGPGAVKRYFGPL